MIFAGTSRREFQNLAESRLREARALLRAGEYDGAYYLAGYCVECALKAVIVKSIPAELLLAPKEVQRIFSHDLEDLLRLAELDGAMNKGSAAIKQSWVTVAAWSEQARYKLGKDESTARNMIDATDHVTNGVFPWLKHNW